MNLVKCSMIILRRVPRFSLKHESMSYIYKHTGSLLPTNQNFIYAVHVHMFTSDGCAELYLVAL